MILVICLSTLYTFFLIYHHHFCILKTELPGYMNEVLHFDLKAVSIVPVVLQSHITQIISFLQLFRTVSSRLCPILGHAALFDGVQHNGRCSEEEQYPQ